MAKIVATIAGRQFRLACEDGQEDHLQALAKDIDQRIIDLRRKFGEIGDTRLTVMAALMVADELAEAMHRIRRLEEDVAALQDARLVSADRAKAASDAVVGASIPPPSASKASPRSSIKRSATAAWLSVEAALTSSRMR